MTDADSWSQIVAVASSSTLVASFLTQWLISWRERTHRAVDFQRKTLIELLGVNELLVRTATAIALAIEWEFGPQEGHPSEKPYLSDKFQGKLNDYAYCDIHIISLMALIENENVCTAVDELRRYAGALVVADRGEKEDGSDAKVVLRHQGRELNEKFCDASASIGEALRVMR